MSWQDCPRWSRGKYLDRGVTPRRRMDMDKERLEELRAICTPATVPPCRICGGELSLGDSRRSVWGCDGLEDDPDRPGRLRLKEGRTTADEHYAQSQFHQQFGGRGFMLEVFEYVDELEAMLKEIAQIDDMTIDGHFPDAFRLVRELARTAIAHVPATRRGPLV